MISWNEFQAFWVDENMNLFAAIIGVYFAAIIIKTTGLGNAKLQTRSKKNSTEKAGK